MESVFESRCEKEVGCVDLECREDIRVVNLGVISKKMEFKVMISVEFFRR